MTDSPSPEALAAEFDTLMQRAGIEVPAARRKAVLEGFADLRWQISLLRGRYDAAAEPSNIFRLIPAEPVR